MLSAQREDETTIGLVLRYIRYGSVTFWAIFGAPWVFLKIKLAERDVPGAI